MDLEVISNSMVDLSNTNLYTQILHPITHEVILHVCWIGKEPSMVSIFNGLDCAT